MIYLTEISQEVLQNNFELAHEHLKQVFSRYPYRAGIDGCPCCIDDDDKRLLKNGDLTGYIMSAMTTWGNEDDFKHYIPQLFIFAYMEENYAYHLICKLNYVKNWPQEETIAITSWLEAYSQLYYINEFKKNIKMSRLNIQEWLKDPTQNLSCTSPFSVFFEGDFEKEVMPFLYPSDLEKFALLLDQWPLDEIDLIAYASCMTNYLIFGDSKYGIFEEKLAAWLEKNELLMEAFFWKTSDSDSHLQKLFSDALPPNYYPTTFFKKHLK